MHNKLRAPGQWWRLPTLMLLAGSAAVLAQPQQPRSDPNTQAQALALENVEKITPDRDYRAVTWSPVDPHSLAFVGSTGTYHYSLTTGELRRLSPHIAGFRYIWSADGKSLLFRSRLAETVMALESLDTTNGAKTTLETSQDLAIPQEVAPGVVRFRSNGAVKTWPLQPRNLPADFRPYAFQLNDDIYIERSGSLYRVTSGDGKYYLPQLSPDGSKVLYHELSRGILVTDLEGHETIALGPGDDAAWSPAGDLVLFELTEDNGYSLIASDLFVADLEGRSARLTSTTDLIEMRPSWSADGRRVAFDANGAIFVADVTRRAK